MSETPKEALERIVHLRTERARRIYVAGPMTGLKDFNFPAFNAKADELRAEGWHVENPAEHGHIDGAVWADYMRWDLTRLSTCGAIYLLPGWQQSRGARIEVNVAQELGLQFLGEPISTSVASLALLGHTIELNASDNRRIFVVTDSASDVGHRYPNQTTAIHRFVFQAQGLLAQISAQTHANFE